MIATEALIQKSVEILREFQSSNGSFVASPTFQTYAYCWFRDSSFITYALDLYGEHERSARFHEWAADLIIQREELIRNAVEKTQQGTPLGETEILHTRYTLEGNENFAIKWENFQLDGFGTWLWAVDQHIKLSGVDASEKVKKAVRLTAAYLDALWEQPCYDCWEEFRNEIHPHTLAAIYAGLKAANLGLETQTTFTIKNFLKDRAKPDGYWQKFLGNPQVDASLLGMAVPYGVSDPRSPEMLETVRRIELDLLNGGVQRYKSDTYYGGGRWILLTAWLGWYYAEIGDLDKAITLRTWIEEQANAAGDLPEQVAIHVNQPGMIDPWVRKWGPSADPLLWSHANYLILCQKIRRDRSNNR